MTSLILITIASTFMLLVHRGMTACHPRAARAEARRSRRSSSVR